MQPQVLLDYIVKPTLEHLAKVKSRVDSPAARQFMVAVAAQESACGRYFKQVGGGPARGIWQVEPDSRDDLFNNYLLYNQDLLDSVAQLIPIQVDAPLITCPMYCCAIARLIIYRQPEAMPEVGDIDGMWELYKKRYNSYLGAATKEEWEFNWANYVEEIKL